MAHNKLPCQVNNQRPSKQSHSCQLARIDANWPQSHLLTTHFYSSYTVKSEMHLWDNFSFFFPLLAFTHQCFFCVLSRWGEDTFFHCMLGPFIWTFMEKIRKTVKYSRRLSMCYPGPLSCKPSSHTRTIYRRVQLRITAKHQRKLKVTTSAVIAKCVQWILFSCPNGHEMGRSEKQFLFYIYIAFSLALLYEKY